MLSHCLSAGGCHNKVSEVDYQLGHRQCVTCRMIGQPLQEEEAMATPKKKGEAIDAEAGTPTVDALVNAHDVGFGEGVAAERERILGGLKAEAMERWWLAKNVEERRYAEDIRAMVVRLEGEG